MAIYAAMHAKYRWYLPYPQQGETTSPPSSTMSAETLAAHGIPTKEPTQQEVEMQMKAGERGAPEKRGPKTDRS